MKNEGEWEGEGEDSGNNLEQYFEQTEATFKILISKKEGGRGGSRERGQKWVFLKQRKYVDFLNLRISKKGGWQKTGVINFFQLFCTASNFQNGQRGKIVGNFLQFCCQHLKKYKRNKNFKFLTSSQRRESQFKILLNYRCWRTKTVEECRKQLQQL